jgi:hypothetical protein
MTSLPPPVVARKNRWAMIAVVASILSLGNILVAALNAFGLPYSMVHNARELMFCQIGHCCVSAVFTALALAGLIMGVTAVVQCRASKGTEKGLGAAYAAVVLSLSVFVLVHVGWLMNAVVGLMRHH